MSRRRRISERSRALFSAASPARHRGARARSSEAKHRMETVITSCSLRSRTARRDTHSRTPTHEQKGIDRADHAGRDSCSWGDSAPREAVHPRALKAFFAALSRRRVPPGEPRGPVPESGAGRRARPLPAREARRRRGASSPQRAPEPREACRKPGAVERASGSERRRRAGGSGAVGTLDGWLECRQRATRCCFSDRGHGAH